MPTIHFATIYEIRKEAGLDLKLSDDRVSGVVNGTNKDFYTTRIPIVDRDNDDIVTIADVLAYVNGVNVAVTAVDSTTGKVTLAVAPANGTSVMLDYVTSEIPDAYIIKRRDSAEKWLRRKVRNVYDLENMDTGSVYPVEWSDATRLYAGGLLQISDYGANVDTDGSSKDGYKKLAQARTMLDDWISDQTSGGGDDPNAKSAGVGKASDGNLYHRHKFDSQGDINTSESEWWNHRV